MFVVGSVTRVLKPGTEHLPAPEWDTTWPVIFENEEKGFCTDAVTHRDSRADAQIVADRLNKAIEHAPEPAKRK
jgi:hypothetical protein